MHKMIMLSCLVVMASVSGCGPAEPADPPPPLPMKTLNLRLLNASSTPRECSGVYVAMVNSSNQLITTPVSAGGIVDSGGTIEGSLSLPVGTAMSANGECWRIGSPTTERVTGSFSFTLDADKDCVMVYATDGEYATMRMDC